MAVTKVQANWANVSFNNTTITRVTACSFSQGGSLVGFGGDTDLYKTVQASLTSEPTASVTSADTGTIMSIASGTQGALTATHKDARNQVNGSVVYTFSGAVAENAQTSGAYAQFGTATITFKCVSSDGVTNPLSITYV